MRHTNGMNDTARTPNRQGRHPSRPLLHDAEGLTSDPPEGTRDESVTAYSTSPAPADLIPIATIIQDRAVWPRADYDADALARYRDCPEALPPVRVDRATGVLLDGFHRVRVHQEAGAETVPVVFEDCPPERQLARALELNRHGAPIPREQRDRVIVQLAEQGFTQDEIAKVAGLSLRRVSQILTVHRRDNPDRTALAEALRMREAGSSLREAEEATGIPKSTIARAEEHAKAREAAIDQHR